MLRIFDCRNCSRDCLWCFFLFLALVQVAVWSIGEYADLLVKGEGPSTSGDDVETPTESQVVDLVDRILKCGFSNLTTKRYAITSLMKLTSRFANNSVVPRIHSILDPFTQSITLEFTTTVLAKRVQERPVGSESSRIFSNSSSVQISSAQPSAINGSSHVVKEQPSGGALLDLLMEPTTNTTPAPASGANALLDLLGDIPATPLYTPPPQNMGVGMGMQPAAAFGMGAMGAMGMGMQMQPPAVGFGGMGMGMGMGMPVLAGGGVGMAPQMGLLSSPATSAPAGETLVAYDNNGLRIVFSFSKVDTNTSQVVATFTTSLPHDLCNLVFQAAVPKYCKIQMGPASSSTVPARGSGSVTQQFRIINSQFGQAPSKVLMRVTFMSNNEQVQDQKPIDLPPGH